MGNLSLQLYSVKEIIAERGLAAVLADIRSFGYSGVETAGFYTYTAEEFAAAVREAGLFTAGMHVNLGRLKKPEILEETIRAAALFGTKHIVCSSGIRCTAGLAEVEEDFASLEKIGRTLAKEGLAFSYHNHSPELTVLEGTPILDRLYAAVDPQWLGAELDLRWVAYAGADPMEYIRRYGDRMQLVHMRQMAADAEKTDCAAGDGVIDFALAAREAAARGTHSFIVENGRQNLDIVRASAAYLLTLPEIC